MFIGIFNLYPHEAYLVFSIPTVFLRCLGIFLFALDSRVCFLFLQELSQFTTWVYDLRKYVSTFCAGVRYVSWGISIFEIDM